MNTQSELILYYLYRFRFLTRRHLQQFLNQKHFKRVIIWLNQLTISNHIRRYYNPKTITIPAIYSLGLNGRKYLLKQNRFTDINSSLLDRVWREQSLSIQFRERCLILADIYFSLSSLTEKTKAILNFKTKTDLNGLKDLIIPSPDAYFSITETNDSKKRFFLDIFDDWPPRMQLRKRVNQYFTYYNGGYWQRHQSDPFPSIILICPESRSKQYLYKYIKKKMENIPELQFYLTIREKVKAVGLVKEVLEKVTI